MSKFTPQARPGLHTRPRTDVQHPALKQPEGPEPSEPPSLGVMVLVVAAIVALVILVFSTFGYVIGKFIF